MLHRYVGVFLPWEDILQLQKQNNQLGKKLTKINQTAQQFVQILNGLENTFKAGDPKTLIQPANELLRDIAQRKFSLVFLIKGLFHQFTINSRLIMRCIMV
jgi:hypothetical protein